MHNLIAYFRKGSDKGPQRIAKEYAEKRRIYKDLISKNDR